MTTQDLSRRVNPMLARLRVGVIEALYDAYTAAGMPIRDSLDGGAGAGHVTNKMLERSTGRVYAFEPFPGNHRFFVEKPRVTLHKAALAEAEGERLFYVPSVVTPESSWGKRGMAGYSSVGALVSETRATKLRETPIGELMHVRCVAADEVIPSGAPVDVIKLDLQGGELNALRGMKRLARGARFLWIEYSAQTGVLAHLVSEGFVFFDTEYLISGAPTDELREHFWISKADYTLSTGAKACFAYTRKPIDEDYEKWLQDKKGRLGVWQTDIVAVHESQIAPFIAALARIPFPAPDTAPDVPAPMVEAKPTRPSSPPVSVDGGRDGVYQRGGLV